MIFFLPMATPNEGSGSEGDDAGFCGPFTDSKSAESNMVDA